MTFVIATALWVIAIALVVITLGLSVSASRLQKINDLLSDMNARDADEARHSRERHAVWKTQVAKGRVR